MIVYHEIDSDSLDSVRAEDIKRTSRDIKGNNKKIIKTDQFLDAHRPAHLRTIGLSRNNNIYGYIGTSNKITDIRDGA